MPILTELELAHYVRFLGTKSNHEGNPSHVLNCKDAQQDMEAGGKWGRGGDRRQCRNGLCLILHDESD